MGYFGHVEKLANYAKFGIMRFMANSVVMLIELFARANSRSPRTIARYATGSGDMYDRLIAGCDMTTRRAQRALQWLSDHWPDDLEWPSDVPRPAPRRDAA